MTTLEAIAAVINAFNAGIGKTSISAKAAISLLSEILDSFPLPAGMSGALKQAFSDIIVAKTSWGRNQISLHISNAAVYVLADAFDAIPAEGSSVPLPPAPETPAEEKPPTKAYPTPGAMVIAAKKVGWLRYGTAAKCPHCQGNNSYLLFASGENRIGKCYICNGR
jgi:hypothetical protein